MRRSSSDPPRPIHAPRLAAAALGLAAALFALPAHAIGVNFAWDHCPSEGGTFTRWFPCDTNDGVDVAVGSFVLYAAEPQFTGLGATIDISTADPALPDWWQFLNPGSCRQYSLAADFDYSSEPLQSCFNPFQSPPTGGLGAYQTSTTSPTSPPLGPNQARLGLAAATFNPQPLAAGVEYLAFHLRIDHANTTGTSLVCAGCSTQICLRLSSIVIARSDGSSLTLDYADRSQMISFNVDNQAVCEPLPVRNTTWGQIKGLYR